MEHVIVYSRFAIRASLVTSASVDQYETLNPL